MFRNLFRPWADHQLCVMRQRATSRLTSCCSFACRVDHVADSQHAAVYLRMSCIQYELVSVSHTSCCCALWLARAKKFGKGLIWIDAGSKSIDVDVLTMVASGGNACIWRPHHWMFPFARCVNSHCGHVCVESIFVHPAMRRRDIGRTLVTNLRQRFPGHTIAGNIKDYDRDSACVALLFWRAVGAVDLHGHALELREEQRHDTSPSNYGFLVLFWTAEFRTDPVGLMSWSVGRWAFKGLRGDLAHLPGVFCIRAFQTVDVLHCLFLKT